MSQATLEINSSHKLSGILLIRKELNDFLKSINSLPASDIIRLVFLFAFYCNQNPVKRDCGNLHYPEIMALPSQSGILHPHFHELPLLKNLLKDTLLLT